MLDEAKRKEIVVEYFNRVNAGDVDKILEMFTQDARIEDPVGREPRQGRAAQREYFHSNITAEVMVTPGHASAGQDGKSVAIPVAATITNILDPKRSRTNINAVDVFTLNDDGLIETMRVFWGLSDIAA